MHELTVAYPTAGANGTNGSPIDPVVDGVSFDVERGQFVVVTGPVGSGKSTLLRALLGLAWQARVTGTVRWNGEVLADRASFLIPPNAAFLPQVPQLISDSVSDNVGLGPVGGDALATALRLAAIDADVAEMPEASETMIGPRGLRLSGGQRQRLATARALVHAPEIVVLDDVSSALDVETELLLWENLADAGDDGRGRVASGRRLRARRHDPAARSRPTRLSPRHRRGSRRCPEVDGVEPSSGPALTGRGGGGRRCGALLGPSAHRSRRRRRWSAGVGCGWRSAGSLQNRREPLRVPS